MLADILPVVIDHNAIRSEIIYRRTYSRPLNVEETQFEVWEQTIDRVTEHQRWLWERALSKKLNTSQERELSQLRQLMLDRKVMVSGRTLWMGGTPISKTREATQFNCAATKIETVYDVVDALWLLLNGAGVGFKPVVGSLNGFSKPIHKIEVIRSTKKIGEKGEPENKESWDVDTKTWTLRVGDSSEAWAKSIGKILAGKYPANKFILDFSEVRCAGTRLSNYGWISSGDTNISKAFLAISKILNRKAGSLLTKVDIMDIMNWLGTSLSSRRAAQIALVDFGSNEWSEFALAKKGYYKCADCGHWDTPGGVCTKCGGHARNPQRAQSNNSLVFYEKPSRSDLEKLFDIMSETGGAEPGFINGIEAERRAPWFVAGNPCFEILLPNKGFCNLVEINLAKFRGDTHGLHEASRLISRANYRQTCVDLNDGILQEAWNLNNKFLRLCGVGLTGVAQRPDMIDYDYRQLERIVTDATYSMADELDLPRPKNVTCIKPSGSLSKLMGCTEGLHKPLGKYIFNNVVFARQDPLVVKLKEAGYRVIDHPSQEGEVVITLPVFWEDVEFHKVEKPSGELLEVNLDTAIEQLDRYRQLQNNWTHHNSSITVSYTPEEVPEIISWFQQNWNNGFVGVSFMYRVDPMKAAEDYGFPYLPQQCVSQKDYEEYVGQLKTVNFAGTEANILLDEVCSAGGMCPVR